jgi:cyanate permease
LQVTVGYLSFSVGYLGYTSSNHNALIIGLTIGLGIPLVVSPLLMFLIRRHCRAKKAAMATAANQKKDEWIYVSGEM